MRHLWLSRSLNEGTDRTESWGKKPKLRKEEDNLEKCSVMQTKQNKTTLSPQIVTSCHRNQDSLELHEGGGS